jgi:hypothetical protein
MHMRRTLLALFLAPLAVSTIFGLFAIVVYPFMLTVTLCVALPLLFFLRRRRWLEWWHALLAGAFCGACFVAVNTVLSYAPNIDYLIDQNNVYFVGLGAAIGLLFWWTGIFRNHAFPFVGRALPAFLVVLPLAALVVLLHRGLEPTFYQGRVAAVLLEPTTVQRIGQVSVRLSTGRTVEADLSNTWPRSMVVGHCFHLTERWSTLRFRRVYELNSPFGGGVDDC